MWSSLFAEPCVVPSWENFMDGLKLLDAFQPLEDGCVDDLLGQAGNLCELWLSFNLTKCDLRISLLLVLIGDWRNNGHLKSQVVLCNVDTIFSP